MPRHRLPLVALILFLIVPALATQSAGLRILDAAPQGNLQQRSDANEIRVVFSEPMVALGSVPTNPSPSWIHIAPAIKGAFRWSGTTILIFTPDPASPRAVRHALHGHDRSQRGERRRPSARHVVPVHVHDADGETDVGALGASGIARGEPGRAGADVQPAGAARRRAGAHRLALRGARLVAAGVRRGGSGAAAGDGSRWPAALRRQGRRITARRARV